MGTCLVKTGFFVLRQCKAKASTRCVTCQRPICSAHMLSDNKICTECFDHTPDDHDHHRDLINSGRAFYAYRRHYYDTHQELNRMDDLMEGEGFDVSDAEAFDAPSDGAELDDDMGFEDSADLFDS